MLLILLVAIAIVNFIADTNYWYWTMRWFDMPMHFAGGVWVAGFLVWWRFFSGRVSGEFSTAGVFLWSLVGAFVVGMGWEVYEGVVAVLTKGHLNAWVDTLSDILLDLFGALVVAICIILKNK